MLTIKACEIKKGMVLEMLCKKATVKSVLNRKGKTYFKTLEGDSWKVDSDVNLNIWIFYRKSLFE